MSIATQLEVVRARIAAACADCGRADDAVALLAVSKTRATAAVAEAFAAGQRLFGENRVRELVAKSREFAQLGVCWHMIGSVQTNKVRELVGVPGLVLLHTLDRRKLADKLQVELAERGQQLDVLLQLNASREPEKHGVALDQAEVLLEYLQASCPALTVQGLMAMGPRQGDPAPVFDEVAALLTRLRAGSGLALPMLSLGMTGDMVAAIAAGSTMVRVGTGVFGARRARG